MLKNEGIGLSSSTQTILIAGGSVALAGYVLLILVPTWVSYGRLWERAAAGLLTLLMLVTLLGAGVAIGAAIIWSYGQLG